MLRSDHKTVLLIIPYLTVCSYDELLSMFTSCQHVTIESLKAKLSTGPDGQTDLGALLVAAKVEMSMDEIVGPPLNNVKKSMDLKGLSDWQQTLCLKIRRRKKNTVSANPIISVN